MTARVPPGEIVPVDGAHDYADYLLEQIVELRQQRDRYAAALKLAIEVARCEMPPFVHDVNAETGER